MKEAGKTYGEISEELGITVNYAKQIIHKGREKGEYTEPIPEQTGRPKRPDIPNITAEELNQLVEFPQPKKHISRTDKMQLAVIGDDRVKNFVQYHIDMTQMRIGVDKNNVRDLYARFYSYLQYCAENGIMPNNMNCYYAIGITRGDIFAWASGKRSSAHKQFAEDVRQFFASVHEQAPSQGLMNPISAIFWQKAHDGMIEAQKAETVETNPLGEMQSAEEIADKYKGITLPD